MKDEILTCIFFGTMAAVFTSGVALTMDCTVTQVVGTAMVFWVAGFFWSLTVIIENDRPKRHK